MLLYTTICERSSVVEHQLPKLRMWVRFPSLAPKVLKYMRFKFYILILILFVSGCATVTYPPVQTRKNGFYHTVRRKETLYSIARKYSINLQTLIDANRIPDKNIIEKGQKLFIPRKSKQIKQDSIKDLYENKDKRICSLNENFIWPVKGALVYKFGDYKGVANSNGIDIKAAIGTNVKVSKTGTVTYCSDYLKGYGKTIIVDHGDGFQSVYAYNLKNLVNEGDVIKQGQIIARTGKGGRAKVPSLHFEIRNRHLPINPLRYLK